MVRICSLVERRRASGPQAREHPFRQRFECKGKTDDPLYHNDIHAYFEKTQDIMNDKLFPTVGYVRITLQRANNGTFFHLAAYFSMYCT